jgi:adenosine deaminase
MSDSSKFNLLKESVLASVAEEVVLQTSVLPKFELHAHINGSIPLHVLKRFAEEDAENEIQNNNNNISSTSFEQEKSASKKLIDDINVFMTPLGPDASPSERMAHCFKVFDVVYKLVQTRQRLCEATRAVVRAFIEDGCIYIELRTTPKSFAKDGTTDDQYISCVLEAIHDELKLHNGDDGDDDDAVGATADNSDNSKQQQQSRPRRRRGPKVRCNLLLSINRRIPVEAAQRVIDLAILFREKQRFLLEHGAGDGKKNFNVASVVGIDFCGDCYDRTFQEFLPAIERAKKSGFPVTIHMGEKQDDEEVTQMLSAGPARVGHCVFISERAAQILRMRQIPLEICITSNMMTGGLAKPSDHHISNWMKASRHHPVTINTDDFSVFSTTLCKELMLFSEIAIDHWLGENKTNSALVALASGNPESVKNKFFEDVFHFVCSELWRVQFHAARCCFLMKEEDRMGLIQILEESHENFWRSKKWW